MLDLPLLVGVDSAFLHGSGVKEGPVSCYDTSWGDSWGGDNAQGCLSPADGEFLEESDSDAPFLSESG